MKYYCPKNFHFFLPFIPIVYIGKDEYKWKAVFSNSCKYDHGNDDQLDWNKLVGVSNTLNPRKDSIRFVWRYNKKSDLFEIGVYLEKDKKFVVTQICEVKCDESIELSLKCYKTYCLVETNKKIQMFDFKKKHISFRLNPYFGGNLPAPHPMNLKLC